jgi:hypothetical protein
MKAVELAASRKDGWRNILITLIDLGTGVNEMVRRRVGFGSAVYIRRIIT